MKIKIKTFYSSAKNAVGSARRWAGNLKATYPDQFYAILLLFPFVILTLFFRISIERASFGWIGGVFAQSKHFDTPHPDLESIEGIIAEGQNLKQQSLHVKGLADKEMLKSSTGFVDLRVLVLQDFFNYYKSPLADYSEEFIKTSEKYDVLNWQLLPAIAINETNGCQTDISFEQKNCWGWGGAGKGRWNFDSLNQAIDVITHSMIKTYENDRMNTKDIQSTYCGQNCMEQGWKWAKGVQGYIVQINNIGVKYGLSRTNEDVDFD